MWHNLTIEVGQLKAYATVDYPRITTKENKNVNMNVKYEEAQKELVIHDVISTAQVATYFFWDGLKLMSDKVETLTQIEQESYTTSIHEFS